MAKPRKPRPEKVRAYSMRSMPERMHTRIDRLKFVMNRTKEEVILALIESSLGEFEGFYKVQDHIPGPNPQGEVQGFTGSGGVVEELGEGEGNRNPKGDWENLSNLYANAKKNQEREAQIGGESFSQHRDGPHAGKVRRVAPNWIPDPMEDSGDYEFIEMYE